MKKLFTYFSLSISVAVVLTLCLGYEKNELPNLLNLNDLNKKLRVLQTTSRKSLADNELVKQLVEPKNYSSK
jgi:hypothetical protein